MLIQFINALKHFLAEILPALLFGFIISGIINEFIPTNWVEKHLSEKNFLGIVYSTIVGVLAPVCCWGSLPLAVTLYTKGASLGPILAILIATPATSVNAIIVVWKFFGIKFAIYTFLSAILMGIVAGIVGNIINLKNVNLRLPVCPHCEENNDNCSVYGKKDFFYRIKSILKFAFIDLPKEIGLETLLGIVLAALVSVITPIGLWIKSNLSGIYGYIFAVIFGLIMYMCATMSVPLVYALVQQGMNIGAGFALLLIGPITSYGTILVIRKEFGFKVLLIYLSIICILSLSLGYLYTLIF